MPAIESKSSRGDDKSAIKKSDKAAAHRGSSTHKPKDNKAPASKRPRRRSSSSSASSSSGSSHSSSSSSSGSSSSTSSGSSSSGGSSSSSSTSPNHQPSLKRSRPSDSKTTSVSKQSAQNNPRDEARKRSRSPPSRSSRGDVSSRGREDKSRYSRRSPSPRPKSSRTDTTPRTTKDDRRGQPRSSGSPRRAADKRPVDDKSVPSRRRSPSPRRLVERKPNSTEASKSSRSKDDKASVPSAQGKAATSPRRLSESKSSTGGTRDHGDKHSKNVTSDSSAVSATVVAATKITETTLGEFTSPVPKDSSSESKKPIPTEPSKTDTKLQPPDQGKLDYETKVDAKATIQSSKATESAKQDDAKAQVVPSKEQVDDLKTETSKVTAVDAVDATFVLPEFSRVMVTKLTRNVTAAHISEIFSTWGQVKSVEMSKDHIHPEFHRGYAYIDFTTSQAASDAVNYMNGGQLDGQEVNVTEVMPKPTQAPLSSTQSRTARQFSPNRRGRNLHDSSDAPNRNGRWPAYDDRGGRDTDRYSRPHRPSDNMSAPRGSSRDRRRRFSPSPPGARHSNTAMNDRSGRQPVAPGRRRSSGSPFAQRAGGGGRARSPVGGRYRRPSPPPRRDRRSRSPIAGTRQSGGGGGVSSKISAGRADAKSLNSAAVGSKPSNTTTRRRRSTSSSSGSRSRSDSRSSSASSSSSGSSSKSRS